MRLRLGFLVAMFVVGLTGPLVAGQQGASPDQKTASAPGSVWTKLDQSLSTGYTKPGEKVSVVLESDMGEGKRQLAKETKLPGTVVKSEKQGKERANAGLVLLFDTAVLKDRSTVPVHVAITS